MIFPKIDSKTWIEQYGMVPKPRPCRKCGIDVFCTIPFEQGDWRGLISEDHGCGTRYIHSQAVSINKEFNDKLMLLFKYVK